jgi:hypothetical protein
VQSLSHRRVLVIIDDVWDVEPSYAVVKELGLVLSPESYLVITSRSTLPALEEEAKWTKGFVRTEIKMDCLDDELGLDFLRWRMEEAAKDPQLDWAAQQSITNSLRELAKVSKSGLPTFISTQLLYKDMWVSANTEIHSHGNLLRTHSGSEGEHDVPGVFCQDMGGSTSHRHNLAYFQLLFRKEFCKEKVDSLHGQTLGNEARDLGGRI